MYTFLDIVWRNDLISNLSIKFTDPSDASFLFLMLMIVFTLWSTSLKKGAKVVAPQNSKLTLQILYPLFRNVFLLPRDLFEISTLLV